MAKNQALPGMERTKDKQIEAAAEEYRGKRNARMALLKEEIQAKADLADLMHKQGLLAYDYEVENDEGEEVTMRVELKAQEKLTVRTAKDEAGEGEADPEEKEAE